MRFETKRFAFAVASAWAVWYTICVSLVVLAPERTQAVFSFAMHYDLAGARNVTWAGFFGGLLLTTVWVAIFAATVGWFFNSLGRSRSILPAAAQMAAMTK